MKFHDWSLNSKDQFWKCTFIWWDGNIIVLHRKIFPSEKFSFSSANGTYFIGVANLDFLAQPKLLLGLCHSSSKLQAVYYCLLLGLKNSYFTTQNSLARPDEHEKDKWHHQFAVEI